MLIGLGGVVEWIAVDQNCFAENLLKFMGINHHSDAKSLDGSMRTRSSSGFTERLFCSRSQSSSNDSSLLEDCEGGRSSLLHSESILRKDEINTLDRQKGIKLEASVRSDDLKTKARNVFQLGDGFRHLTLKPEYQVVPKSQNITHTPNLLKIAVDSHFEDQGLGRVTIDGVEYISTLR